MQNNLTTGITGTVPETATQTAEANTEQVASTPEQTFTKSQLNEMMRKRVERSHNAFFKRYGVNNLEELDELVAKASSYDEAEQQRDQVKSQLDESLQKYGDLDNVHKDLVKRYAYKVGNIDESKINDIETYFKGKQLDINEENLMNELKTHPDWVNKVSTIEHIGVEAEPAPKADEALIASQIFGVDLTN